MIQNAVKSRIDMLEQSLHFKQVFKAVELMGYEWAKNLVHIPYGLVSLEGAKLSTRKGHIIYAEDILKEAIGRAYQSIEEKNPGLDNKEEVAKMVGVGAVVFHDLFNQRIKNICAVYLCSGKEYPAEVRCCWGRQASRGGCWRCRYG